MSQKVFIIGATGRVGRAFVSQIYDNKDNDAIRHKNPTIVYGVASSKSLLYSDSGLDEQTVRAFSSREIDGRRYNGVEELVGIIRKSTDRISVIDVTAAGEMLQLHRKVIDETEHAIVTANKLPLVMSDTETFNRITAEPSRYGFRCTVMAGAEAVDNIRDLRDLGDAPIEIVGSFSGTLGYIFSRLQQKVRFSKAVKEAVELGYAEPHPEKDLDGADVANKILILSRTAGFDVSIDDVKVEPLVPHADMQNLSAEEFISRLPELDDRFEKEMDEALNAGKTIKYIAKLALHEGIPVITVGMDKVPLDSEMGRLKGTMNRIIIKTMGGAYNTELYSVEAPGSGPVVTAHNLRRNLLQQLKERSVTPLSKIKGRI